MSYKWCAVPECTNTTIKTPEKLFITVPKDVKVRKKWLQNARRDPREIKEKSVIFFCEDHFDIEKDMANYYQYKMGFSQKISMMDGVAPTNFYCQKDRRKSLSDISSSRPVFVKRKRTQLKREAQCSQMQEVLREASPFSTQSTCTATTSVVREVELITADSQQKQKQSTPRELITTTESSSQYNFKKKNPNRSRAIQTKKLQTRNTAVSPFKNFDTSNYTSPFKIESNCCDVNLPRFGKTNLKKRISFTKEEKSDSDISLYFDIPKQDSSFVITISLNCN